MYLMFEAFPIVYIQGHHFGTGESLISLSSDALKYAVGKVLRDSYGYQ